MKRLLRLTVALVAFPLLHAGAQTLVPPGYPNVDRPLQVAPGESVHLLNRVIVDRGPGVHQKRIDFQYRTSIPAGDESGRAEQAVRAAQLLGIDARDAGARVLALAICDTDACARRDAPPRTWYLFEYRAGSWVRVRN